MTIQIAYLGFGKSTTRYHLPYVQIRDTFQVSRVFTRQVREDMETAYPDIQFSDQIMDVLGDPEISLVVVCTPSSTHYEYAKLALSHGKHVLVEKPFCENLEQARELTQLAKEHNLIIMPYQNRRFDSDYLAFKEALHSGKLGDIVEIESHYDYFRPDASMPGGNPVNGMYYGLGVHTLDRLIALFGRPEQVGYDIKSIRTPQGADDYNETILYYPNKKVIVKTSLVVCLPYPQFTIHGTKGSFVKWGDDQQETWLKAGKTPDAEGFGLDDPSSYGKLKYVLPGSSEAIEETIPTPVGDYGQLYDSLYASIVNGTPKLVKDEEILLTIEILENGFKQPSPSIVDFRR
ncbi:oxidoreductase [Paenibacillus terrae]|uniref:oxidoreductase n=1 Tax=Paenibacillus terrae TaxID=159743 RepID=UPI0011EAD48F|nr:oxidoreductase [Paenibacillus terrae]